MKFLRKSLNISQVCLRGVRKMSVRRFAKNPSRYLCGRRILPQGISKENSVADLIENSMLAYNAGRIREACHLLKERYSQKDVTMRITVLEEKTKNGPIIGQNKATL